MLSRNRRSYSERRRSPLRIILITVAAAILLTVIVGNLLRVTLGDEELLALQELPKTPEKPSFTSSVRNVHAYTYTLGSSLDRVWESSHASVSLNSPDGTLSYTSPVASHLDVPSHSERDLEVSMDRLNEAATYISGVFYTKAPTLASLSLCDAEAARDAALMREFLREGGDEILLLGLPFGNKEVKTSLILSYIKAVKSSLEDAPLAVALPLSAIDGKNGHSLMASVAAECDLLALDLRTADGSRTPEEWLAECDYYLSQYDMRLILSETQTELIAAAERLSDIQTVKKTGE
ncbi:MAG: hypothetical protein E7643_00550 [Ruminococcaceae bacterium]|nr:hypothetical protein [Oscillospiraceae bacterium]